jgi:DNA-binding response OmpR family regulator
VQKVILVVQQNAHGPDTITNMLWSGGYQVLTAADGATAIDVARHNPISLVIIDPESLQPGWTELCHELHRYDETAHAPILMLANSEAGLTQMMRHGPRVNSYLMKPFAWEELRGRVRVLLRASRRKQKVILVVERDGVLRDTMTHSLRGEGYLVLAVTDDAGVIDVARNHPLSMMILDPTSPQSGIDTCRLVRACTETARLPILMMATSEIEIAQMVRLNPGVNDYIVKPFLWEELHACVRALLRGDRHRPGQKFATTSPRNETTHADGGVLVADTLRIDLGQRRVIRGNQHINLGSGLLFDLLVYLVRHRGDVLTRDQLLRQVWCRQGAQGTRTVDVHVHWLRQKLHDDLHDPKLIQTVPGIGYRFTG